MEQLFQKQPGDTFTITRLLSEYLPIFANVSQYLSPEFNVGRILTSGSFGLNLERSLPCAGLHFWRSSLWGAACIFQIMIFQYLDL